MVGYYFFMSNQLRFSKNIWKIMRDKVKGLERKVIFIIFNQHYKIL